MVCNVSAFGIGGIKGVPAVAEVFLSKGIPEFEIIGLGDVSVKEAKTRVIAAIGNQGYNIPPVKITVNLSPSGVKKEGTYYDLAIAAGILCSAGIFSPSDVSEYVFIGELSLDGTVRPVNGILAMITEAVNLGFRNFIIPEGNLKEAALVGDANVFGVTILRNINSVFDGSIQKYVNSGSVYSQETFEYPDYSSVFGQKAAKRALEIAAAGGHNALLLGSQGSGKTMMCRCFQGILPPLDKEESYEVTSLYSVCGLLKTKGELMKERPFREVHSRVTKAALSGGGRPVIPGEVSLSHKGVLFLDEMTEMDRNVSEVLRQPLESHEIRVPNLGNNDIFPADFILLGAANPCKCGKLLDGGCSCTPIQRTRALSRISRPILDRIDILIPVRSLKKDELRGSEDSVSEHSSDIRKRVCAARAIQKERSEKLLGYPVINSKLKRSEMSKICMLTDDCQKLLDSAAGINALSMRAYEKVIKVSRTIADMKNEDLISPEDIAEALSYRSLEREVMQYAS